MNGIDHSGNALDKRGGLVQWIEELRLEGFGNVAEEKDQELFIGGRDALVFLTKKAQEDPQTLSIEVVVDDEM